MRKYANTSVQALFSLWHFLSNVLSSGVVSEINYALSRKVTEINCGPRLYGAGPAFAFDALWKITVILYVFAGKEFDPAVPAWTADYHWLRGLRWFFQAVVLGLRLALGAYKFFLGFFSELREGTLRVTEILYVSTLRLNGAQPLRSAKEGGFVVLRLPVVRDSLSFSFMCS